MIVAAAARAVRIGPVSVRARPRAVLTAAALAAVLAVLFCIDIARGDYAMGLGQVLDTLTGGGTRVQRFVIFDSRLPRTATAVVVGAALGMSGAITQSVLRNPLASPDMLGITAGAGFGATAAVVAGTAGALGVPVAALLGGLATALAVYLLAWRGRGVDGFRLVLIGIGINAALTAGVGWLLVSARLDDVMKAQVWLNGSLSETSWDRFWPTALGLAATLAVAAAAGRSLAALRFGPDTAQALGVRFQRDQALLLLAAVTATALATAAAGPVVFVGLCAGQLARRLMHTLGEPIMGSALVGAVLVVGSDII
ncbi:MAG: iron chelate uptake ABC transporter family permease subunit, partial [Mycobacteriaceae bacterium]|nr:iron chelate uptake ABC transporter family permease subunit [Mycobacteriaceae bacterium]